MQEQSINFVTVADCLPEVLAFAREIGCACAADQVSCWETMTERVQDFFTPETRARFEEVLPGWGAMAGWQEGVTQTHVLCVLVGQLRSAEYEAASPVERAVLEWAALLHDIAKKAQKGRRDYIHGFRSAAQAGLLLSRFDFPLRGGVRELQQWAEFTAGAVTLNAAGEEIQDNRQLPQILEGIERLFGWETPGALLLQTILLHMSVNVLTDWPQAAPLSSDECARVLTPALRPLLKAMMLADNDGWEMFHPLTCEQYRTETRAAFAALPPPAPISKLY